MYGEIFKLTETKVMKSVLYNLLYYISLWYNLISILLNTINDFDSGSTKLINHLVFK